MCKILILFWTKKNRLMIVAWKIAQKEYQFNVSSFLIEHLNVFQQQN